VSWVADFTPDPDDNVFRAARKRMKLSQQQVATRARISKAAASQYEIGQHYPSEPVLDRLCLVLGLNYEELVIECRTFKDRSGMK
jgi:transcriptional regulator with XRE-family HTH domain